MNVLFLTHRLPFRPDRGDRIRAYYLLREMSRFADVSLVSLVHDRGELQHVRDVPFARQVHVALVSPVRGRIRAAAALATGRPLTHAFLDAPDLRGALETIVDTTPPDLVVAYCSGMARFALEPPCRGCPFVFDMVDVDSMKWANLATETRGARGWIYGREARCLRAFEEVAVRAARATLVVNDREAATVSEVAAGARPLVVPNGIELSAFTPPGPPADEPLVIFCGVLNYFPNEQAVRWFAERVWPMVRAAHPRARFLVVGASPTPALTALQADGSIEIVGPVDSVQPYLWQSAVSVAPLRIARGLQNKVLEALAAGLPVVVSKSVLNGLPVDVHAGCDVADEPADFAAAVNRLLAASPTERRARAARAELARLAWNEQLRPLERILQDAARR
jgi:sugar transferase (PEP-CTERM/EpsH1 system associated)